MTRINIEVDNEKYRQIKIAAAIKEMYVKDYIIEILKKKIKEMEIKWQ